MPPLLREMLTGYEAGEAHGRRSRPAAGPSWAMHAQAIRTEVFIEEQRIPDEMEWDEADATAVHAVAYNRLGQPVATGRPNGTKRTKTMSAPMSAFGGKADMAQTPRDVR